MCGSYGFARAAPHHEAWRQVVGPRGVLAPWCCSSRGAVEGALALQGVEGETPGRPTRRDCASASSGGQVSSGGRVGGRGRRACRRAEPGIRESVGSSGLARLYAGTPTIRSRRGRASGAAAWAIITIAATPAAAWRRHGAGPQRAAQEGCGRCEHDGAGAVGHHPVVVCYLCTYAADLRAASVV